MRDRAAWDRTGTVRDGVWSSWSMSAWSPSLGTRCPCVPGAAHRVPHHQVEDVEEGPLLRARRIGCQLEEEPIHVGVGGDDDVPVLAGVHGSFGGSPLADFVWCWVELVGEVHVSTRQATRLSRDSRVPHTEPPRFRPLSRQRTRVRFPPPPAVSSFSLSGDSRARQSRSSKRKTTMPSGTGS